MTTTSDIGTLIVSTEGIVGGRPRIANTRVSVQRIAAWYKKGLNAEEIVERMGNVTLAQVYAALAYYHLNREEIESYLTAEKLAYEQQTVTPSHSANVGDFCQLHSDYMTQQKTHWGIVIGSQNYSVGEQMRRTLKLIATQSAEAMQNQLVFLSSFHRE